MSKLFSFITKNEAHYFIRIAAKVFRVFYIILSFLIATFFIINGILDNHFEIFILMFISGIIAFFIIMFIGMFIESLLVGFANIIENQFEELVLKNKSEDKKESFTLSKKQKANFELLEKFNELRKSGAISDEEFEKKKKEYLGNL